MKKLLFRLDGVPDDEAADIRLLLEDHEVSFYETPGGKWGVSVAGIWVEKGDECTRAKSLIAEYAKTRAADAKKKYAQLKQEGKVETILDRAIQSPLTFITYIFFTLLIIYLTVFPFLWFLQASSG